MSTSKLIVRVLNEGNSKLQVIDKFEFYKGETRTLKLQIWQEANNSAYIIPGSALVEVKLLKKTDYYLEKELVIDLANGSVVSVDLTSDETEDLISGDIIVTITDGSHVRVAKQASGKQGMVLLR